MIPTVLAVGLSKRFVDAAVLEALDFRIEPGEFVGIGGANGSGRTTLLRILATLVRPTSGRLEISGVDAVRRVHDARRRVMFASGACVHGDGLRVREYLDVLRASRSRSIGDAAGMSAAEAVARAQLPADAFVDVLSTGLLQQLALAAALLVGRDLIVIDDGLTAVDAAARARFAGWLRERRDAGIAIVAALNDEAELLPLCHRVMRLEHGRLLSRANAMTARGGSRRGPSVVAGGS
jgi:ABC-2 type transport system ATP-binding protein